MSLNNVTVSQHVNEHNLGEVKWVELQEKDNILKHVMAWLRRDQADENRTLEQYLQGKVQVEFARLYGSW